MRTWFGRGLDQDWVDSVNGFWTVLLLATCSAGTFIVTYITQPINCWTPAQFTPEQSSYAMQTCFRKAMYYVPMTELTDLQERPSMVSSYHLWIPLILFFQALCFKIPNIIWNFGKHYLTVNVDNTVDTLKQSLTTSPETRKSMFQDAARFFAKLLEGNKFFLALLYLFVKLLFCLNLLGQLIFLSVYFGNTLVIKAGSYINVDLEASIKPFLMKDVLCDFSIRKLDTLQRFTVQCILPITEMYEKLFVFLWYWVFLLVIVTVFNLLLWAGFLFIPFLRDSRISAYIKASPGSSQDPSIITRFISGFLGVDGVVMLSLISKNSSEMVAAHLSQELYRLFLEQKRPGVSSPEVETAGASAAPATAEEVFVESEKPPVV